jgi:hypothetical protein
MDQLALSGQNSESGRLDNSAGANAAGADIGMHSAAIAVEHPNSLQVGQPTTTGLIIGVADVVPGGGAFATYLTYTGHVRISSEKSVKSNRK